MSFSIMLDAGHGGEDPGAVYNGRQEKEDVLRLVLAVGKILEGYGIEVKYTRTTDIYESPYEKAQEANQADVDLFLSIHRNSTELPDMAEGVESLIYDLSGIKYEIAKAVDNKLEALGFQNRGVFARPNLVVLKRTKMPAVLVEAGFINSEKDNQRFDEMFENIAQAIAEGILDPLRETGMLGENLYKIQVGAFRNQFYAKRLEDELTAGGFPAYLENRGQYLCVMVGNYHRLNDAVEMEQRLKRAGYGTWLIQEGTL